MDLSAFILQQQDSCSLAQQFNFSKPGNNLVMQFLAIEDEFHFRKHKQATDYPLPILDANKRIVFGPPKIYSASSYTFQKYRLAKVI